jgi:WD40 repeat protein
MKFLTLQTGKAPISSLELCETLLAVGASDSSIRVFELPALEDGKIKMTKGIKGFLVPDSIKDEECMISCLKISRNLLYASCDTCIYVFDLDLKDLIVQKANRILAHPSITEEINQFVLGSESTIAIATDSGSASVFTINKDDTLTLISEINHENICSGIALKRDSVWSLGMMEYCLKRSNDGDVLNEICYANSADSQKMNPPFGNCLEFTNDGNICAIGRGDARISVLEFADNSKGELAIRNESLLEDESVHNWSVCAVYVLFFSLTKRRKFIDERRLITTSLDGGIGLWESNGSKFTMKWSCRVDRRIDCVAVVGDRVFVGGPSISGDGDGGVDVVSLKG